LSVASALAGGGLVSDDVVLGLIREKLNSLNSKGFLLDGYPRNIEQARQLDSLLEEIGRPVTHVIEFVVSDDELISRIQHRQSVSGRSDDTVEIARERLGVYARFSMPVLEFYQDRSSGNSSDGSKFSRIDGVGSVDEVFLRIKIALG
jgi:adenylate kinase